MNTINEQLKKVEANGLLKSELQLGVVSSVTAHTLRVNLGYAGHPSASYFSGGRYGKGEVGEFVLVESQQGLLFGRITEVRLPETERHSLKQDYAGNHHLDAVALIQLLGSVPLDSIGISAGVDNYPRLGDRVYAAPHQFVALIPALMDIKDGETKNVRLTLGTVGGASEGLVSVTPETLFGRHCAILGATGGGKSWTTSRIIEECLTYDCKIILLDATGEYSGFSGNDVMHRHLGVPIDPATGSIKCSLSPTSFQESDFIALFDPAGKVQGPKLRAAIRSLRLAKLKPGLAPKGFIEKIDKSKLEYLKALQDKDIASKIDSPWQDFDVFKLPEQIEQECVHADGFKTGGARGEKDPSKWGGESGEFSNCLSLVSRIHGVLQSAAFSCVFKDSEVAITKQINDFLGGEGKQKFLRICLSGIQYEFNAREIISNVLGRHLLTEARTGKFRKQPVIVIVDEAHNFLGKHIGSEDSATRLDAFELIAKEGRKYGLNICLATQRPRDITEGVLSQMGTMIVHRLTNDLDRGVVERACGEIDRSASAFLPNLKPGEAAIIGVDFPIPLTVQMHKPTTQPKSDGPNYQTCWQTKKGS